MLLNILVMLVISLVIAILTPTWRTGVYTFFKGGEPGLKNPNIFQVARILFKKTSAAGFMKEKKKIYAGIILCIIALTMVSPFGLGAVKSLITSQNPLYEDIAVGGELDLSSSYEYAVHLDPFIDSWTGLGVMIIFLTLYFLLITRLPEIHGFIDYDEGVFKKEDGYQGLGYIMYGLFLFTPTSIFTTLMTGVPITPMNPGLALLHVVIAWTPISIYATVNSLLSKL